MNLKRFRGDTYPIRVRLSKNRAALDVTGYQFALTLHTNPAPAADDPAVQKTGAIEDAPAGLVRFDFDAADVDRVGLYYYDMQLTDAAGKMLTFKAGSITFVQDLTK